MQWPFLFVASMLFTLNLSTSVLAMEKDHTIESQFENTWLSLADAINGREPEIEPEIQIVQKLKRHNIAVKNLDEDGLIYLECYFTQPAKAKNLTV